MGKRRSSVPFLTERGSIPMLAGKFHKRLPFEKKPALCHGRDTSSSSSACFVLWEASTGCLKSVSIAFPRISAGRRLKRSTSRGSPSGWPRSGGVEAGSAPARSEARTGAKLPAGAVCLGNIASGSCTSAKPPAIQPKEVKPCPSSLNPYPSAASA